VASTATVATATTATTNQHAAAAMLLTSLRLLCDRCSSGCPSLGQRNGVVMLPSRSHFSPDCRSTEVAPAKPRRRRSGRRRRRERAHNSARSTRNACATTSEITLRMISKSINITF
jgi:hypothetical protein